MISLVSHDRIEPLIGPLPDFQSQDAVFTFEGLIRKTPFITLHSRAAEPAAVQAWARRWTSSLPTMARISTCCSAGPRATGRTRLPAAIPQNLPPDKVIFSAAHFVSNGKVPDITHIVYVDLEGYSQLPDPAAMRDVGRAVGRLNKLLPKRQFILVGPGRWGSRGDIKLGVPVTYSDINNTAMLIEVARQKGNYLPELSFGTHFFQDLVEASIRYLPLYPDDPQTTFKELFFQRSHSVLVEMLPEFAHLVGDAPRHRRADGNRWTDPASAHERRLGPGGCFSVTATESGRISGIGC